MKSLNEHKAINEAKVKASDLEKVGDEIFNSLQGPKANRSNTEDAEVDEKSYDREFRDWNGTYRWETEEGEDFEEDDDNEVISRFDKTWQADRKKIDVFKKKYKNIGIRYSYGEKNWVRLYIKLK